MDDRDWGQLAASRLADVDAQEAMKSPALPMANDQKIRVAL